MLKIRGETFMSISKQLYKNFGYVLSTVIVLLAVNLIAVQREHSAKAAAAKEMADTTDRIRFHVMQNRLFLSNYLLSGDSREVERVNEGSHQLTQILENGLKLASSDEQRSALEGVAKNENTWVTEFLQPMLQKRREVDAGNATVADLQIYYLQKDAFSWVKTSTDYLDVADHETKHILDERRKSDETAGSWTIVAALLSTLGALGWGIAIAYRTANSITKPLTNLMQVAGQIGESGDLDHKIDIQRDDEIGQLGRTFGGMVTYLKEMAGVSEAIAGGNLTVEVRSRSKNDTLGNAFAKMTEGLRSLVRNVRDAASQVASASAQVAGASDESAKISLQTSSAIDEMVASIQRVADTAKVLLDISNRSREEVHSGITTMEKATEGLNKINNTISSSGQIIGVLGQRADDIGKIIEVIDDLAEQTNLLALNAAIEAARAGEHGLGFAVVADEVRKLAEKSTQSTKEIADLIQSIQREARQAVENMERSTRIVEE